MGTYSDGSTQDLTSTVTWDSDLGAIATIDALGLASTLSVGATQVSATLGALSDSTVLTVTAAELMSIAVTPNNPSVALGVDTQFTATADYSDGSQVDVTDSVLWVSANTGVATISNANPTEGLAETLTTGSSVFTAALGGVTGFSALTVRAATLVSIDGTPNAPAVVAGLTQQMIATGTYTDGSTQVITNSVVWSSTNAGVATVSNAGGSQGLATAVSMGMTTIRATSGAVMGSEVLTVSAAELLSMEVTSPSSSFGVTDTMQYTATGTYTDGSTPDITTTVTWSSTSPKTLATYSIKSKAPLTSSIACSSEAQMIWASARQKVRTL